MKSQAKPFTHAAAMAACILFCGLTSGIHAQSPETSLPSALTFHASFDRGIEADYAKGEAALHTITSKQPKETVRRGLHAQGQTAWVKDLGLQGGAALRFNERNAPWIFYRGEENVDYRSKDWQGSISLWLKVDPEKELAPGYADPLQLTTRAWNDAAFFVDFNKDGDPRDFRLGAFADLNVWNPDKKELPESERPLYSVKAPPFGADQWTHVLFTWQHFNTGKKDGIAKLYMNGKLQGAIKGWDQTFSWKPEERVRLYLGLNYIGLLDEVSCFNRPLNTEEIRWIYKHPQTLKTLAHKK